MNIFAEKWHLLAKLALIFSLLSLIARFRRKEHLKYNNNNKINTESLENLETFFQLRDDTEWRLAKSRRRKIRSITKNRSIFDAHHHNLFDCSTIEKFLLPNAQFLAAGWTKAVYRTAADPPRTKQEYAIKTVDMTGQDVGQCLEKFGPTNSEAVDLCYTKAAKKIVKEIALLDQMRHPNIIEVFGYCIPKNFHSDPQKRRVMIVTELGEPVNLIKLLQLSWEDRLKIVLSLAQLLNFLSHNHYGSIIMNDMRRQQFVLIKGQLKLVDVDDVGLEEPRCIDNSDCRMLIDNFNYSSLSSHNRINSLKCINSSCSGFNEMKNVFNTAKHFTTFLLPYGAPDQLKNRVEELIEKFQNQLSSDILLEEVIRLRNSFAKGLYLGEHSKKSEKAQDNSSVSDVSISRHFSVAFRQIRHADLIGLHDYSCKGSSSFASCQISVSNIQEAEAMCQSQEICRAFVWTNERSWTGRNIVYFKNNATDWSLDNRNTTLYVKIDQ